MDYTGILIGVGVGGCFVLIFGIVGVVMLVKYFRDKKKSEESQAWSGTSGRITESYVRESQSQDSDGYTSTTYYPEVRYLYQVMGVEYDGKRVAFGGDVGGSRKKANERIGQYPVGKTVTVYYDPNNHEDAVLERRIGSKTMLIIGIVFALISICSACISGIVAIANLAS
ncbi:MAG: DUF3592 domain-containing protein [Anaerolineae bacterium]|jgi:hypothetical protein|nr:DUF3592 domain-containing protein [Anaerolineae bacterium]MBT4458562.1 DUF3592 domain-containing protein [Anaerolineae bacterium]MBT6059992.1 DUF3592 domain-containing protein [Anaerolineae bacterium]MBT6322904.1 DUF3592 domain-containing protein [Anaerolineae bacterium]MBT7016895.1 DUF3592 domain-containing protein [Anaerolineae bacterium]